MKPLDTRSEYDQARTLEWMYRIFSGSAPRKSQTKVKNSVPLMATEDAMTADAAEARQASSDTAPPS
jgi:hypothetical protein